VISRRVRRRGLAVSLAAVLLASMAVPSGAESAADTIRRWPSGTILLPFEDLEGLLLLPATITGQGGRDTSGVLVLDTGAGFLALDRRLATWAGIADSITAGVAIGVTARPLPRLTLGALQIDQSNPVMTIDGEIVRSVTDRNVLGLLGELPMSDRAVHIDFRADRIALIPSAPSDSDATFGARLRDSKAAIDVLRPTAHAIAMRLAGDGKILVQAVIRNSAGQRSGSPLTLILDTGSTKCVLFERSLSRIPAHAKWKAVHGLTAPTLLGSASASIARVPRFALDSAGDGAEIAGLDVALIQSPLAQQLSGAVGQRVDGLLGVSFLARFEVAIDYPHRILWLDPIRPWKDPRPYEYCHVGLQLERRGDRLTVAGLVENSPAASAGVRVGDDLVSVNGRSVDGQDVSVVNRLLEGPPGTRVTIGTRREGTVARHRLTRRRLL